MTKYYGVKCKTCETRIVLGRCEVNERTTIAFYVAPLDPVPCMDCGSNCLYGSDDLFEFEAEDNIPISDHP